MRLKSRFLVLSDYCLFLLLLILLSSSCSSVKNITYFENVPDSVKYKNAFAVNQAAYSDPYIQPNDILQISVQTLDPQVNNLMGAAQTTSFSTQAVATGGGSGVVSGYLVDKNGFIELPLVGKLKVGGLTTSDARVAISKKASVYYKDPVVNVRFANFTITVLGEVNRPSQYVVPNEKVSVLDALGMAGDLTIYGKRENVLLIRDKNGIKEMVRFDLNNTALFSSPYFYLQQGDYLYVEPNKSKTATTDVAKTRTYSLLISGTAVMITLILRFIK